MLQDEWKRFTFRAVSNKGTLFTARKWFGDNGYIYIISWRDRNGGTDGAVYQQSTVKHYLKYGNWVVEKVLEEEEKDY